MHNWHYKQNKVASRNTTPLRTTVNSQLYYHVETQLFLKRTLLGTALSDHLSQAFLFTATQLIPQLDKHQSAEGEAAG